MKRTASGQRDLARELHQGIADRAGKKVSGGIYSGAPAAGSPRAKRAAAQKKAGLIKPRVAKKAAARAARPAKPRAQGIAQGRRLSLNNSRRR